VTVKVDVGLTAWRIERLIDGFRIAGDHSEIGSGRLIRLCDTLFPIAQRAERNMKSVSELFLGKSECAADDLDPGEYASSA
jgi:hypothetical protein